MFDFLPLETNSFSASPIARNSEKFLAFSIGGEFFAVSAKNVTEVIAAPFVARLPNAPAWLLGIANLHGEIVAVADLPKILQIPNSAVPAKAKFLILRSSVGERDLAFQTDEINEIIEISSENIRLSGHENSSHIFGQIEYRSQMVNLIDAENLFAALQI